MKWIAVILLFLSQAHAAPKDERLLLKCLGEEEKRFHLKKEMGPIYDLNQRLITEMLQIPKADIREEDYKKICGHPRPFSESWKLLQLSIIKGTDVFYLPESLQGMQRQIDQGMIEDYIESTKEIFLNLVSQIQVLSPTPTCLKEEIPELDAFFTEIKYLQEDVDLKVIFKGKDQKIFEKLKGYSEALKRCRERARIKKKPKDESVAAPKKS